LIEATAPVQRPAMSNSKTRSVKKKHRKRRVRIKAKARALRDQKKTDKPAG
jgi:hypothetical protein